VSDSRKLHANTGLCNRPMTQYYALKETDNLTIGYYSQLHHKKCKTTTTQRQIAIS